MKNRRVTVPRIHHPGRGHPAETLAYLSPLEHELIRKLTDGTYERGPGGIKSYADDSASSKGVSRGDKSGTKGSGGLGQGGQGGGNRSSGAGNRSGVGGGGGGGGGATGSRGSSTGGNMGQGGQNSGAGGSAVGRGASSATGRAADAAKANASRGGSVSNPVSMSGSMDRGFYHSFTNDLPGMANPNTFDRTIRPTNMVNTYHVPMDTYSKAYDPNRLTAGAQKIHQAIVDNAFRTNTPVDFFSGRSPRASGTPQHPSGQALDIRLRDPVTGAFVGTPQIGAMAANPIGNVKPLMGRSTRVAKAIQGAIEQPYRQFATGVMNSFMTNPGVYGDFNNQRWGGSFGGTWGKDYMHYDEGKVNPAVNADQTALRKEAANYSGPGAVSSGTMLAGMPSVGVGGTQPPTASRPVQVAGIQNAGMGEAARLKKAQDALNAISAPSPTIPADPRVGLPQGGYPASPPRSAFAADPRLNVPQGAYPAQARSHIATDPRVSQTPVGGYSQARAPSQVATDPRVSEAPVGAFPAAQKPASVFAQDPRLASPLGAYPASVPQQEIQLAWNVPPLGGALPSWKADALGVWGTNRKPSGPAAQPGTIHSQTAQAEEKPSFWQQAGDLYKTTSTAVQNKVAEAKATPEWKFAQDHPRLAEFALKMMMGGGGNSGGLLGTPQDRGGYYNRPQPVLPPMQQASVQQPQDQLQNLLTMQQQMIERGASPEELAAIQALIDQLSVQEA